MAKHFKFTTKDGAEITAPAFDRAIDAGFLRRHRNDDPVNQMFAIVEEVLTEDALAVFDTLSLSEMEAFYTQWQEDAGVTAGE